MCGIAGFVGNKEFYNPFIIKLLGLYQDSRGGDGAGIAYIGSNMEIIKGCQHPTPLYFSGIVPELMTEELDFPNITSLYELFTNYHEIKSSFEGSILMHSRRTTIGLDVIENIHPIRFPNIEENSKAIIGVHNGTVRNYKELAAEIQMPESLKTSDSNALIWAIAQDKLLDIYWHIQGGATLVWVEESDPTTLNVLCTANAQGNVVDRPLHILHSKGNGAYISSESHPLSIVRGLIQSPTNDINLSYVQVFRGNIWYKLSAEYGLKEYKVLEKPVKVLVANLGISIHEKAKNVFKLDAVPSYTNLVYYYLGTYWINNRRISTTYSYNEISKDIEIKENYLFTAQGMPITAIEDKYFGVNKESVVKLDNNEEIYEMYFLEGILLKSREDFISLIEEYGDLSNISIKVLRDYTFYPTPACFHNIPTIDSGFFFCGKENIRTQEMLPVFSTKIYKLHNGFLDCIIDISRISAMKTWKEDLKKHFKCLINV